MAKINRFISVFLGGLGVVFAAYLLSPAISAQSVLQGYKSDDNLQKGMLVALKEGDEGKLVALTHDNASKFKGVIVDKNDSPVTISSEERNIFVATSGPYEVLVTNENGPIAKGDYIVVSSSAGIGAKATDREEYVVGVAAAEFTGGGDSLSKTANNTNVGRIKMDVSFGLNPGKKEVNNSKVPSALKKLSESIVDKPVSTPRIYLALSIFMITASITAVTLYSGVRNAIISIGRNPLSKSKIIRGLVQVVVFALIVFLVGLFGVYLILKL
jgi:hypothetical protein